MEVSEREHGLVGQLLGPLQCLRELSPLLWQDREQGSSWSFQWWSSLSQWLEVVEWLFHPETVTWTYKSHHEETCPRGLRPGKTQTGLLSYTDKLESWNFGFSKYVLYYLRSKQQRCWSDRADAQADLHLCCLHILKQVFSWRGSHNKFI